MRRKITGSRPPIRVLIVEDFPVAREFLTFILSSDPAIQVAGAAHNGLEALKAVQELRPDVITMDIHMPMMDGFEATRRIMETQPTPIVIVSSSSAAQELAFTFRALEAGALAVVRRPPGQKHGEFESAVGELVQTVKLMSEIKVVRRSRRAAGPPSPAPAPAAPRAGEDIQAVAIGASTGGPPALQTILKGLPREFPAPILIVQHIASGFAEGFAQWLAGASGFPVSLASHGERLAPGRAYLAPEGFHMGVERGPRIALSDHAPENGLRPSVAHLFRTAAQVLGPRAVGVLLSGMGKDGAEELKLMKAQGATTIVQDEASSVVYGMPGEAVKLGAETFVLAPEAVAAVLAALAGRKTGEAK